MSDLIDRIRSAQIAAGERAVMDDLREKGLLPVVEEVNAKMTKLEALQAAWLKYGRHTHDCQRYGQHQCTCGFVETCIALGATDGPPGEWKDGGKTWEGVPVHPDPTGKTREIPHCPTCECGMDLTEAQAAQGLAALREALPGHEPKAPPSNFIANAAAGWRTVLTCKHHVPGGCHLCGNNL